MLVRLPSTTGLERRDIAIDRDPDTDTARSEYGSVYRKVGATTLRGWGDLDGRAYILALDGSPVEYIVPALAWTRGRGA